MASKDNFMLPDDHPHVLDYFEHLRELRDKNQEKEAEMGAGRKSPSWISLHMNVAEKRAFVSIHQVVTPIRTLTTLTVDFHFATVCDNVFFIIFIARRHQLAAAH